MDRRAKNVSIAVVIAIVLVIAVYYGIETPGTAPNNSGRGVSEGLSLSGMTIIVNIHKSINGSLSDGVLFHLSAGVNKIFLVIYSNNTTGVVYAIDPHGNIWDKVGDDIGLNFSAGAASYSDPPKVVILSGNWTLYASGSGQGNLHAILAID